MSVEFSFFTPEDDVLPYWSVDTVTGLCRIMLLIDRATKTGLTGECVPVVVEKNGVKIPGVATPEEAHRRAQELLPAVDASRDWSFEIKVGECRGTFAAKGSVGTVTAGFSCDDPDATLTIGETTLAAGEGRTSHMAFFDIPDVDAETDEGLCFVNFAAAFLDLLTSDDTDIEPYRRWPRVHQPDDGRSARRACGNDYTDLSRSGLTRRLTPEKEGRPNAVVRAAFLLKPSSSQWRFSSPIRCVLSYSA